MPTKVMRLDERAKSRLQIGIIGFIFDASIERIHHFYRQFGYFLRRVVDMSQTTFDEFWGQAKFGGFASECLGQGKHPALRIHQQFWNKTLVVVACASDEAVRQRMRQGGQDRGCRPISTQSARLILPLKRPGAVHRHAWV